MSFNWSTKEKLVLLSDILEYGDQNESWTFICNDLSKTFQNNLILSQMKKETKFSIKNCKQEYRILVDRYQSEWIEQQTTNPMKYPLAKFIWLQLKSIYQNELTQRLNESRKKLTEFCLRFDSVINQKSHRNESFILTSSSTIENGDPLISSQQNESTAEEKMTNAEKSPELIDRNSDVIINEPLQTPSAIESPAVSSSCESFKVQSSLPSPSISQPLFDQSQIKQEPSLDTSQEKMTDHNSSNDQLTTTTSNLKSTSSIQEIKPVESIPNSSSLQQTSTTESSFVKTEPISSTSSITNTSTSFPSNPSGESSSQSTSRKNSETKTESIKIIPTTTTTPKYHLYFSPKNTPTTTSSTTTNQNSNITTTNPIAAKAKTKKRTFDETKDDGESESNTPSTPSENLVGISSTSNEAAKISAPMTRRSVNTRSIPNNIAEQEEEKARRFSAMLSENPNSWQSQSNAIIQYLLSQKQGYLFEHEITDEIAPKYHQFIRRPIALDTIRKNLESNLYLSKEYFKRDVYLMFYNAMKYNPRFHHVHRSARNLFQQTLSLFNLSSQEIQEQITRRTSISSSSHQNNEIPSAKRKRIK